MKIRTEGWREVMKDEEEDISSYWMTLTKRKDTGKWKEEALDRTLWRTVFGSGYGPTVRRTAGWMNEYKAGNKQYPVRSKRYVTFPPPNLTTHHCKIDTKCTNVPVVLENGKAGPNAQHRIITFNHKSYRPESVRRLDSFVCSKDRKTFRDLP